ncbi:penicillin-binding protein [Embleya sp. NBC_00888]|uniref:transglycosylase domain-containing protein n=1 Tax=Embleya sp. NBC_00888 TaxID=2975960 RepID=UPI00387007BE|nr:penicillin-binding protein [Embleya sp. NBC_00888]
MARTSSGSARPKRGSSRSRSPLGFVGRFAAFVGASILAGALVAGIALPFVGGFGLTAKAASENFDDLPSDLDQPFLSQPSYILDSEGNQLAMVYDRYRILVNFDQISPIMRQAIVAIEDSRFYEHGPIDLKGTLRALMRNQQSGGTGSKQGGSSLTQQYVKNIFVEEAGNDPAKVAKAQAQEVSRKVKELKYAIGLEQRLSKDEILTRYLNITFFGRQAYGVEAASQRYFSKHAKDLTLTEAATLAGVVQAPSAYDPIGYPNAARERRNIVLQRMAEVKVISQVEADAAKATELNLKTQPLPNGCITADQIDGAAFFCDYVERVVKNDPAFGANKGDRDRLWREGGLRITTTLDRKAQKAAYTAATKGVLQKDPVADAVVMVEPGSGRIKAMAQSRPYGFGDYETTLNYSVDHSMGGSTYGFQTGSTFKPITAAAALESGMKVDQEYSTGYDIDMRKEKFRTCGDAARDPKYQPQNESRSETGTWNMQTALEKSINTYFVLLSKDVGLCPIATLSDQLGVHQGSGKALEQVPSMTLGANTVAPMNMAAAYAAFASRGVYCSPIAVTEVAKLDGTKLPVPQAGCKQVMKQSTADTINALLKGVVEDGTGTQAGLKDRDNAGKTGTTNERKAAWFVGYTPNLSTAVWIGGAKDDVEMVDITIAGVRHDKVYGGQVPGPIWKAAMSGALKGVEAPGFVDPPSGTIPSKPDPNKKPTDGKPRDQNRPPTGGTNTRPPWTPPTTPTNTTPPGGGNGGNSGGGGGNTKPPESTRPPGHSWPPIGGGPGGGGFGDDG